MNITLAQYYLTKDGSENDGVKIVADERTYYVPLDPANRHYQAIQEWVAEGNTIEDAD
jgi:hypothetical protein